ncbi:MAG: mechanosensitive ion channel domain-containing protein [Synechococcales bacterium]|nr:mechanosensitive ion channel domain-containing protein [Synechococcales bacterium]
MQNTHRPTFGSQWLGLTWFRGKHRWLGQLAIALVVLFLCLYQGGQATGAVAPVNQPIETAPVVLDGQPLFEISDFQNLSAAERAAQITDQLEDWAEMKRLPEVTVDPGIGNSTILLNGEHLLTVTKTDAIALGRERSPEELAEAWVPRIEAALQQAQKSRQPGFIRFALLQSALALALAGLSHWWLGRFQRTLSPQPFQDFQRLISGQPSSEDESPPPAQVLTALALVVLRVVIWGAAVFYITNLFPFTRERTYWLIRRLVDSFVSPVFPLGNNTYSITDVVILLAAFLGVLIASRMMANLLRSRVLEFAGISSGSQEAIAALTRYTLVALGTVVVLQVWGLDLSSLTIIASALGVGIGFGLQNIARDFGSGLVLLFERPVQVGDFIEVGDFMGTVDRIGARSTTVKTLAQVSVIVPNSYFLENQVINWSHDNPLSRISIPVGVAYSANPNQVRDILLQAGRDHSRVVKMPQPQVFFKGFGDSSIDFELLVWIMEPNRQPMIKSELYFAIFDLFHQHGIEIPFPQRDLHLRTDRLPIELMEGARGVRSPQDINGREDR